MSLPPHPPKQTLQHDFSISSHAFSAQYPNKDKALAHKSEPTKGKQVAMSPSSDSSCYYVTSHSIPK